MHSSRRSHRSNTLEIKALIFKKIGRERAEMYFTCIRRFLGLKITKMELMKLLYTTIGRDVLPLHNLLIRSIARNSFLAEAPPAKLSSAGQSRNSTVSTGNLEEMVLASPRKETSVNSHFPKLRDRPCPLGPRGSGSAGIAEDVSNSCDLQGPHEFASSKVMAEMCSVEDGEQVEQVRGSPGVQSRSPVTAPLGILTNCRGFPRTRFNKCLRAAFPHLQPSFAETCRVCCRLPDRATLRKRLQHNLEAEGLFMTDESVDLLNSGLDIYLKRLIKPCMELARARCNGEIVNGVNCKFHEQLQNQNKSFSASLLDFRVAMELNPRLLGDEWPVKLEKICLREYE